MRKLLVLVALLAVAAPVSGQSHFLRGDTNDDGSVDIGDALFLLTNLFTGGADPICLDTADANDDGGKDIGDAVYLLSFLFTAGPPPAAPYPTWELDPTPDALSCKGTIVVHNTPITGAETWSKNETHVLEGQVEVAAGGVLTIEAGTTVLGDFDTQGFLVVNVGGQLIANGSAVAPIVFTSEMPVGSRNTADWGGVIVLGPGQTNWPGNVGIPEGLPASSSTGGDFVYGGDPVDTSFSSGSMRYVRIEFGGTDISPNNEINALSMFAVNNTTTFEFIQVKQNLDDGFEWFGGNADLKYGLASAIGDDKFDYSFGWQGRGQFWVGHDYDNFGESGKPDNGFEVDNREEDLEFEFCPRTDPRISNVTMIGDPTGDSDHAFQMRRGCAGTVINAYATGWTDAIVDIDDASTTGGHCGTELCLDYVTAYNDASPSIWEVDSDEDGFTEDLWFLLCGNPGVAANNVEILTAQLGNPHADLGLGETPDFAPIAGSALLGSGTDASTYFGDAWFDTTDYRGGVGASDWTQGSWISYQVD